MFNSENGQAISKNVKNEIERIKTFDAPLSKPYGLVHAYGGFQEDTTTLTLTAGVWEKITNITNDLWIGTESEGISLILDSLVIKYAGDYYGMLTLAISGLNGKDFFVRVYNNTQGIAMGYKIGATTTSTANFIPIPLPLYFECDADDVLEVQIYSSVNATVYCRSAVFWLRWYHK